jgi:hypothetical protein
VEPLIQRKTLVRFEHESLMIASISESDSVWTASGPPGKRASKSLKIDLSKSEIVLTRRSATFEGDKMDPLSRIKREVREARMRFGSTSTT